MKKTALALFCLAPTLAWGQVNYGAAPTAGFQQCPNSMGQLVNCVAGTYASKPTGSSGMTYYATDIGPAGCLLEYNGSIWKPASGCCTIGQGNTSNSAGTGAEANYATITIPAGFPSSNGYFQIRGTMHAVGANGTKTITIRHNSTSGATSGGNQILSGTCGGTASTLSANFQVQETNTATNAQRYLQEANCYIGNASTVAEQVGSIDTASASYININANANASDTVGFDYSVQECE